MIPLVGFYAMYISLYTLYEPGIGQKVRNTVIKKQILFVLISICCNMPIMIAEIIYRFNEVRNEE